MAERQGDAAVKSAARVVEVLEAVAGRPSGLTFTELLEATAFPRSSLHGLVHTLADRGVIRLDSATKRYTPGPKLWELAMGYAHQLQLVPVAWPLLESLRDTFDETVQMGVLEGADVLYVAKASSSHPLQLASHVGSRLPAYATGLGKALLAGLEPAAVKALVPAELPARTPDTFRSRAALEVELRRVRERGYARDLGEYSAEVRCLAAPVVDHTGQGVAAVSVTMASERFDAHREDEIAPVLLAAVQRLSAQLGGVAWDRWRSGGK